MDGKLKKMVLISLIVLCGCVKKNHNVDNGHELISQQINTLLDSLDYLNPNRIPRGNSKSLPVNKFTVALLDSIVTEEAISNGKDDFLKYKIQEDDIINFKQDYKVKLVQINNYDINTLFVKFSNFEISGDDANINVTKTIGVSSVKDKYRFKKDQGVWVFKKKERLSMG